MKRYIGDFDCWNDVTSAFGGEMDAPGNVFAIYDIDGYEGGALCGLFRVYKKEIMEWLDGAME